MKWRDFPCQEGPLRLKTRIEKGPALPWPFWYLSIKTGGANRKASENTRKGTELHVR